MAATAGCCATISDEVVKEEMENRPPETRSDKQQRGVCVRKACRAKAGDSDYCPRHERMQRVYNRLYMRRKRAEREAAGLCPRCGKMPPLNGFARCAGCQIMAGSVPHEVVKSQVENHSARVAARKLEWEDSPTNAGRKNRLRGGKRGRRSLADDDQERLLSMRRFVEKLSAGLAHAHSPQVKALGRIQREDATQAAMSWALLIWRTCGEMLAANDYPLPEQITDDDD